MFYPVDSASRGQAKSAHELAMLNLLLVNLLMLVALLAGSFLRKGSPLADYRLVGVLIPLGISLGIGAFTSAKAARLAAHGSWFVAAHWRLARVRFQILLVAYALGAGLISMGWLLSTTQQIHGMQELMFVALQRVAIAPLLIVLMVLIMLESGALYQAGRGEVPDSLLKKFPPPADWQGADTEFGVEAPC